MKIHQFTLNKKQRTLLVEFINEKNRSLPTEFSFEFLRVFSPTPATKKQAPLVCHKKQVQLIAIEPVGKHGFRFVFDDDHREIYNIEHLVTLAKQQDALWQQYLAAIKQSGHSREAMINITEL